jgi:hypothetical protein
MPWKDKVAEVAYKKAWAERNKERLNAKRHAYWVENRERLYASNRQWALANPEKTRGHEQAYRDRNRERLRERSRMNHIKRRAQEREYKRGWARTPRGRFKVYRDGARARGFTFKLTFEEFMSFWQQPCHYCGDEIQTVGLDRLDNLIGYLPENIAACCETCNNMKKSLPKDTFLAQCRKVAEHRQED